MGGRALPPRRLIAKSPTGPCSQESGRETGPVPTTNRRAAELLRQQSERAPARCLLGRCAALVSVEITDCSPPIAGSAWDAIPATLYDINEKYTVERGPGFVQLGTALEYLNAKDAPCMEGQNLVATSTPAIKKKRRRRKRKRKRTGYIERLRDREMVSFRVLHEIRVVVRDGAQSPRRPGRCLVGSAGGRF